jgi:transcriptional regulator with XRE-family HTH domain
MSDDEYMTNEQKGGTKMNNGDANAALGNYVCMRRKSRGMDVRSCAAFAELDVSYWHKLEKGAYAAPNPATLRAIATTIDCPLQDLYALCGYATPEDLPAMPIYLRAKFGHDLPPEAIADLERYYAMLRGHYGIPDDEPVFPPQVPSTERQPTQRRKPSATARNKADHPWRGAA